VNILERSVYLGPNTYALFRVIRLRVDLGELEEWPTGRLGREFQERLVDALPGLADHGCSYEVPGGFLRRMNEDDGTWLGHVVEHVALEIQNMAGAEVSFGKTRSVGDDGEGIYDIVYEYEQEEVGLEAGRLAMTLVQSLLPTSIQPEDAVHPDFDWEEDRDAFIRYAQRRALGPSTAALVKAAEEREIPHLRLNRYSLVQFGHGRYQRRIQATVTGETRHIAVEIASDKEETNGILQDLGLPVPYQELVYSENGAVRTARRIGYPVVLKPLSANHGRGVSINLEDEEQVRVAFEKAREHQKTVIVESYIRGFDHRMLVVNGELIAVAKRVPGHVVGDGKSTVEELVDRVNDDPRRGIGHEKVLTRLVFDHQALRLLEQLGYDQESVPPDGEVVYLRSTGNLSTGGTASDVTDIVHPDNRDMAVRAAQAIGLDVAGVDFLTTDISRSYKETGGAICEVNAAPGFRMHVAPSDGQSRDVAGPVIDMLFPPGSPSRLPIAAITGTNGKTTTARMLAHIHKMAGSQVGLTTTDGVYIDGRLTVEGDMTGPVAARMVLRDPSVDVAVLETARGGLLKRGMGTRRVDVGACLNVASDHLGLRGVNTLEELAHVKRTVVEVARGTAVLNADDALCLKMADYTQADYVCYVTMNPTHPLVKAHIQAGGRAAVLEQGITGHMITLYDAGSHIPLLFTQQIPATLDGRAMHNVQNALFAAAMAYSMDVALDDIRHGLQTFDSNFFQVPGRMNICDDHPFKVILDYGHNPAAVRTMVDLAERLAPESRRLCVLASPGDRRDEDMLEIGEAAAGHFDTYICRDDDHLRGREPGEAAGLIRKGLLAGGADRDAIQLVLDEQEAVRTALERARPGDLVLVFGDEISRCWQQICDFDSGSGSDASSPAQSGEGEVVNVPALLPAAYDASLELEGELIRDERGVRLARERDD